MLLRQLEYLVALARERHFVRAAESCHVSQPTLSEGLRRLEDELGVPLVRRGRRFEGLTPEGERVLLRAQRLLADRDALRDEAHALRHGLTGTVRIGAVPTASTAVSLITTPLCAAHPRATVRVEADLRAEDIAVRLRDFDLDAALTYLDPETVRRFRTLPLYREHYVLLTADTTGASAATTWREAALSPLCLLEPGMQGRRVLDSLFAEAGTLASPRVETDSIATLFAHVRTGAWTSIVPVPWLQVFGVPEGLRALPLAEPDRAQPIGLVLPSVDPPSAISRALTDAAAHADLTVLEALP
ncbi:DNA-binding transcriptional LysR family regulator [Actinocorallia herbida]|uniref:DNA-binding transcriptional LysR family regulator n=1 Tax=Actinocorallia herbida TaxID=58109 RepID=A0A3N1CU57_9ACTN|nr:LysR family transcriptional regulator [Actinocorallia herbida]ROO84755.1 DNA-binding transcriptional LysR family regulator [Actinocorallia herbida]